RGGDPAAAILADRSGELIEPALVARCLERVGRRPVIGIAVEERRPRGVGVRGPFGAEQERAIWGAHGVADVRDLAVLVAPRPGPDDHRPTDDVEWSGAPVVVEEPLEIR